MFHELCGYTVLKHVVLVTDGWDEVPLDIGEAREKELSSKFFKPALDNGVRMVRHRNTVQSARNIVWRIVEKRPVVLRIQRELVDEKKDIADTKAGKTVDRQLNKQIRRHRAELKEVRGEKKQALSEKDEETIQELEEERKKLRGRIDKITKDLEGVTENYAAEKERMEVRVKEMEQEANRERADPERKRRLADRIRRLQDEATVNLAERLKQEMGRVEQEMERVQARPDSPSGTSWIMVPIYR